VIHEFRELIPVKTPLGSGYAMLLEPGEFDTYWTVIMDNQAVVTFTQEQIRVSRSYTHGRGISDRQMKAIIAGPSLKKIQRNSNASRRG
jgi:hypothetical protein